MKRWWLILLIILTAPIWIIGIFCWQLFVKIVNIVGIKILRNAHGKLQTPVIFYENSENKRSVIFVGMTHIAEKQYFEKVWQLVNSLEKINYKVLYEFARPDPQHQPLSEEEQKLCEQINGYRRVHKEVSKIMGLTYQFEEFKLTEPPPSWINNDVSQELFIHLLLQENLSFFDENKYKEFVETFGNFLSRLLIRKAFKEAAALFLATRFLCRFSKNSRELLKLILDYRNKVALEKIFDQLDRGYNVVNIWGAAHIPGIEKVLKEQGFKEVYREWLTAYDPSKN